MVGKGILKKGWRPWLRKELEKKGFNVFVPAMPESANPIMNKWVPYLSDVVKKPDEKCYFVGHSLGCITILRYLKTLKGKEKVGGVVLVAGFGEDLAYEGYKRELSSFFAKSVDWEKIKKHCKKFVAINSEDDPWVSIKNNKLFQEKLSAKSIIHKNMKHYSGDDGVNELPIVLEELLEISSKN